MQIDHLRKELARLEAIVAPGNNKIPFPTTPIKPFLPTTTMKNGLDELLEQHLQRKMNGGVNIMVVSPTSTVQVIIASGDFWFMICANNLTRYSIIYYMSNTKNRKNILNAQIV